MAGTPRLKHTGKWQQRPIWGNSLSGGGVGWSFFRAFTSGFGPQARAPPLGADCLRIHFGKKRISVVNPGKKFGGALP